jgi:hypothetical protein
MRSRAVRFVARLLIFALYLNGLGPLLIEPGPVVAAAAPASASPSPMTFDGGGTGSNVSLFGPKKYTRTGGLFNLYTDNITVPDWIRSPYTVRIKNGESDGSHRVSGATIFLSGLPVATPLDLNQFTDTVERPVLLLPILVQLLGLSVKLIGPTGSYVTITVLGRSGDTHAPSLTITDPATNGTTTNDNTPHVALTYADSDTSDCHASGIDTATLKITLDGIDRTSLFTVTSTGAQATIPDNLALSDGTHALHAEIRDRGGNLATADRTFSVHTVTQPPTLTVTAPAEGALVSTPTVSVSGSVTGHGTGAVAVQCRVGATTTTGQVSGTTWTCAGVGLQEGDNAIVVTATDSGGSSSVTRHVALDTTVPTLVVVQPVDGQSINSDTVTVSGSVSDAHAVTVRVNTVDATITGTSFTATVPVGSGPTATITITATDAAGNATPKTLTLHVDRVAPALQITSPADGAFVRGSAVQVTGTVTDTDTVQVDINGHPATVTGNTFTAAISASDGPLTLTATGRDTAGNSGTAHVSVTVDSVAPSISVSAPADGAMTRADSIHFTGTLTDASPTTLRIDGTPVAVADGAFAADVPVTTDGARTVTLVATDAAGNTKSLDWHVTIDRTAPTIDITTPASNAVLGQSPVAVDGHYQDGTATTITVNGINATLTQGAWHADVPLTEGSQTLTVVATDAAGNRTTVTRNVILDFTKPVLSITSPADGSYTTASTVTVSGTVTDSNTVTVSVNGVAATVNGAQFEAVNVPVGTAANNTIEAIATDAAGNQNPAHITLHVPQSPLTLTFTNPTDGAVVPGPKIDVHGTTNSDLHVNVRVNDVDATVNPDGTWVVRDLPVVEGSLPLHATAIDAAGRTQTADATVRVDTIAPTLTVTAPTAGFPTNSDRVHVTGSVSDLSSITVTVNDQPVTPVDGEFATDVMLPSTDTNFMVTVTATDSVGNTSTKTIAIVVDRTPPTFTIVGPGEGTVVANLPVLVQGSIHETGSTAHVTVDGAEASITDETWSLSVNALDQGPHTFTVIARDDAGNIATAQTRSVIIDTAPPVLTITSPASATLTKDGVIQITGSVSDNSPVIVTIGESSTTVPSGTGTFTFSSVALQEGDNTILVTATDGGHRSTFASVVVTRDSIAPQLDLATPERITRRQAGQAVVTATDPGGVGVAQVVFMVNGSVAATLTETPFLMPLTVPDGVAMGQTFKVSAIATDRAGNVTISPERGVRVAADGAIVGQVLSDATGLPIKDVDVRVGSDQPRKTDDQGRYTLPTDKESMTLLFEKDTMTSVSRVVSMASGVGTVPIDARLTPLAAPVSIGAGGGPVSALGAVGRSSAAVTGDAGALAPTAIDPVISINVPPGALSADTDVRLTPLSGQGLPDLLPLGWSPLAAFDLRSVATLPSGLDLTITFATSPAPPAGPLALVEYRPLLHTWFVTRRQLTPNASGLVSTALPNTGVFALVVADVQDPAIDTPAEGAALTGVPVVELPATATSHGLVEPGVIPPAGGTARGQLRVDAPLALPSGTLVQAEITETFTLPSNQVASEEERREDIILYRAPARAIPVPSTTQSDRPSVSAALPIAPSRTFDPNALIEGHVHLDILAGRESIRGTTGGQEAVTITADDATLVVPRRARTEDTAITLRRADALSTFLPTHATLTPLAEVVVDVPGALTSPAELSVSASNAAPAPGVHYLIARVDRVDGVPFLTVVALADIAGDRLVAVLAPGLPGVIQSGRYLFYRVQGDLGVVDGVTRAAAGQPITAIVGSDTLPFIIRSGVADGRYTLITLAGAATISARVPGTSLETHRAVTVPATGVDLALAAVVTTAAVVPTDGARAVSRQPQIVVTTSTPMDPEHVSPSGMHLWKVVEGGTPSTIAVPFHPVLASSRQTLAIVPDARLDADTSYRLEVSGIIDIYGGVVSVPVSTFRTAAEAAPTYSIDDLTFSFPDGGGNVTVTTAPTKKFPVGTQFLIINSTSGQVLSFGTQNDGTVSSQLRATLNDRLVITITDPDGRVTTTTRSQFVDTATGRTSIGPGGGIVEGPGGIQLRIPEGAVSQAVTLKITQVGEDQFPTQPAVQDGHFGGGIKIEASANTTFAKEVDVAFPIPDNVKAEVQAAGMQPKDAFYYIYRRTITDDGSPIFETVDYANVEGDKVVTASFPFSGLLVVEALVEMNLLLVWTFKQLLPGQPTEGVITGLVRRPVYEDKATEPTYKGVAGARVELVDPGDTRFDPRMGANTQADGRYTITDHRFVGGPVKVKVTTPSGETGTATVFAVDILDTKMLQDPGIAAIVAKGKFKQIANANITLAPEQPAPPAPALTMRVMKTVEGHRVDTHGLAVSGDALIIGIEAGDATVTGVTINGESHAVQVDPATQVSPRDPLAMGFIMAGAFTPPQAGTYTVVATALAPFGPPVTSTMTFRVLAAGGTRTDNDPTAPPAVITALTVPRENAKGVAVTLFPQVTFSEPVLHIPGNVFVRDHAGINVPIRVSGVGLDSSNQPVPIADVTSAASVVTSLTLEPLKGLIYGETYHIELTDGIIDRDTATDGSPAPKNLVAYSSAFTTFGPSAIGGTDTAFASPGLAVLGDRAFVLETKYAGGVGGVQTGALRVFDVSNPVQPVETTAPTEIAAPPRDIAGEDQTVAVVTMPLTMFGATTSSGGNIMSGPGNLLVYDVGGTVPRWSGAATLTDNIMDGVPNRVVIKDQMAYVATTRKGIQVVDLSQASIGDLNVAPSYVQYQQLFAPGAGKNQQAVVASIPVFDPNRPGDTSAVSLLDLKVGDYTISGAGQRLVLATGYPQSAGLVMVNPTTMQTVWQGPVASVTGSLSQGNAIARAHVADRDLVLVGGYGTSTTGGSGGVVAIVDLSPLESGSGAPSVIAWVTLTHGVADIVVFDQMAIVSSTSQTVSASDGEATLINLADPFNPQMAGTLSGVGNRLALTADGTLLSTARTFLNRENPLGGVRTATFKRRLALITKTKTIPIGENAKTGIPTELEYRLVPGDPRAKAARVRILTNAGPLEELSTIFDGVTGTATWAAGRTIANGQQYFAQAVADEGTEDELLSARVLLPISSISIEFDEEHKSFVAHTVAGKTLIENTWDSTGRGLEPPINGYAYQIGTRTFGKAIADSTGNPPNLPDDYILLRIHAGGGGALVWDESKGETVKIPVPETGQIEAHLKATKELSKLSVEKIVITAEYYASSAPNAPPMRLKDEYVIVANERLHGRLYDLTAAAFGRGEGVEGTVTEMLVGMVPFAGDAAGIAGEAINAIDPNAEVNKINLVLSIVGLATEFLDVTAVGAALDKGIVFIRVGMKQIEKVKVGPLSKVGDILYRAAKGRDWARLTAFTEGTMKASMVGGERLMTRVVKEDEDLERLNRVVKRYSEELMDTAWVEKMARWDEVYQDADAVRGAIRSLDEFKDAAGNLIRLSDEATEGAVKFMAKAGSHLSAAEREALLKQVMKSPPADVERMLAFVKNAESEDAVKGFAEMAQLAKVCTP